MQHDQENGKMGIYGQLVENEPILEIGKFLHFGKIGK